jgi:hypothetical protein
MKKTLKYTLVASAMGILAGCGGGGSSSVPTVIIGDPKFTAYSSFDLESSVLTGNTSRDGVLQGCGSSSNPNTKQINLSLYKFSSQTQSLTQYNFILDGNFYVPNINNGCNTTGITGFITGVTLLVNSDTVYTLSSLYLDAAAFKYGYKPFWDAVSRQTYKIVNTQTSSSVISCKDSTNKNWSVSLKSGDNLIDTLAVCFK